MSLYQDRQIKGFLLFLTLFALLFVGTATVLTIYQVNDAEVLWLKHDEAVSSSLLEQGVPKEVVAVAFTNTDISDDGRSLLAAAGLGKQSESSMRPYFNQFQRSAFCTMLCTVLFFLFVLAIGIFIFFWKRKRLYQQADKILLNYINGDYPCHLPQNYEGAIYQVFSSIEQLATMLQSKNETERKASGTVYHVLKNEKYKGTYVGAKFIMPVPCKHRVLRAPLEQQVRIEDSHAAIVTPEEFEQAQKVIMLQHGKHQAGNYTKHQYPLKGKVYCGYCQKLMKYRVLKKLGPSFNCRFSATAADSPCKRIPISEKVLEEIIRNALTAQIKQAEYVLEILHERERKALICFSALERQEEKLSAEKAEIVKQRVALYEQYADGNMSKEEFIRQRDAYRVQEDEKMEQIQRLRTEKNQAFQPVKRDTDHLQTVMSTVEEAGDVMYLSQNVVETFIDRIEVFNDEHVKIHFTFENVLADYAE